MNKIRISTLFEDIFDIQFFKYWMNIEKRRYNKVLKSNNEIRFVHKVYI